jgi:hypothetical protein
METPTSGSSRLAASASSPFTSSAPLMLESTVSVKVPASPQQGYPHGTSGL